MASDARQAAPARDEMSHLPTRPEGRVCEDSPVSQLTETILVVDDEPDVLALAAEVLRAHLYTVFATGDPREALRIARSRPEPLHLLLTDVVMPWMNGRELAGRLRSFRPDIKVLFMSAYSSEVVKEYDIQLAPGEPFVVKPFAVADLTNMVRAMLNDHSPV